MNKAHDEKQTEKEMVKTTFFPKDLAYRFSTLLVVAGCYLFYEIRDNGCKDTDALHYIQSNINFYEYFDNCPAKNNTTVKIKRL